MKIKNKLTKVNQNKITALDEVCAFSGTFTSASLGLHRLAGGFFMEKNHVKR